MGMATLTVMNKLLFLPLYVVVGGILSVAISGCGNNTKSKVADLSDSAKHETAPSKDTVVSAKFPPLPIDYDKTKVLRNMYVVDRNGVELRQ